MSSRSPFSPEQRASIARAWREAESRGEQQAAFCDRQSPAIRPRTLRQWLKAHAPRPISVEDLRAVLLRARSDLDVMLAALEHPSARRDETATGTPRGEQPASRHAERFDWDL